MAEPKKPVHPVDYKGNVEPAKPISGRDTYNLVTDTVAGPNLRFKDNMIQLASIGAGAVLGSIVGLLVLEDKIAGVVFGGTGGVVAGLFISGIALGIYRAVRHAKGKHD